MPKTVPLLALFSTLLTPTTLLAASFTLNSVFLFQPDAGIVPMPDPSDSFTNRFLEVNAPGVLPAPITFLSVNGFPAAGEANALSNSINSASYAISAYSILPSIAIYGATAQGSFSDGSLLTPGFGPIFTTELGLDDAQSGTVTLQIDNTLVGNGPKDASVFFVNAELFSPGSSFVMSPISAILDLRGDGQATWLGSQGISASGSNYTISIGLTYLNTQSTSESWFVKVVNGIVTSEQNSSSNPILLPPIGSSGDFMIPLPIEGVSYDSGQTGTVLSLSEIGESFNVASSIPEPRSGLLTLGGCAILLLVLVRRHTRWCARP